MGGKSPGRPIARAAKTITKFGEYTLVAELARGGMGRVFLARRGGAAGFERLFAIKVLHEHMADDPEAVKMLLDEANIASKLHHPNVVPIVDIGKEGSDYYLVMDYVEGCSFNQLLARNLTTRHARLIVPVVLDALRGLNAAHELLDSEGRSQNLIHRDFSPHNLLVGIDGSCRVTDFGIAKVADRFTQTQASIQKGKMAYMPPEQLRAEEKIDRRVDIWAAGVVLYYALTGVHPLRGDSQAATVERILNRDIPLPSIVGQKPPECLDQVCMKALERDVSARYESAAAMADDLQRVAVRNDLLATPSQVGTWVSASFGTELEQRRRVLRAIGDEGAQISWLSLPQLPGIHVTPTGKEMSTEHVRQLKADVAKAEAGKKAAPTKDQEADPDEGGRETLDSIELEGGYQLERESKPDSSGGDADAAAPEGSPPDLPPMPMASPLLGKPTPVGARKLRPAMIVGAALAVGLVLAGAAFWVGRSSREEDPSAGSGSPSGPVGSQEDAPPERPTPPVEEGGEEGPASPSEPAGEEGASGPEKAVRIVLRDLPEGATVRLDGVEVNGLELDVTRDGTEHVVRVDAEGYQQWSRAFVPSVDATFHVRLVPRRRPGSPRGGKRTRPDGPALVRDPGF